MAKKVKYLENYYDAGAVKYAAGKIYVEDDNTECHLQLGIAEYTSEKVSKDADPAEPDATESTEQ